MYKSILLTDKELELLESILKEYIGQKKDKSNFEIYNAHIILRHICGFHSPRGSNQLIFYGKESLN